VGESGDFQHQWAVASYSIAVYPQQGEERVGDAEGIEASVESREEGATWTDPGEEREKDRQT
jgi:hypothetical protein